MIKTKLVVQVKTNNDVITAILTLLLNIRSPVEKPLLLILNNGIGKSMRNQNQVTEKRHKIDLFRHISVMFRF